MSAVQARRSRRLDTATDLPLLQLGQYVLDAQTYELLTADGRKLRCSRLEYKVLSSLMLARGRPVSLERLMTQVYGDQDEPDVSSLRVCISNIRKKARLAGMDDPLRCDVGIGYRMCLVEAAIEVLVLDRERAQAFDRLLAFALEHMPDAVALLRRADPAGAEGGEANPS